MVLDPQTRDPIVLLLFVAGRGPRSQRAIEGLERLLGPDGDHDVTVVDVHDDPGLAETHGVLATPTLIRLRPEPPRRVVGDLADGAAVRAMLGLADGQGQP